MEVDPSALLVNSQDLGLLALNQARKQAELMYNFEFSRRLVTVTVDGVTGGSLSSAVLYGTNTVVDIKNIVDLGMFDSTGNLIPAEWTTISESLVRQREDNPSMEPRYVTDGWRSEGPVGRGRFVIANDTIYRFPKDSTASFDLGLEVYSFDYDWTDLNAAPQPWATHGSQYLLWQSVVFLNHRIKSFVPRQEGNLAPPTDLANAGLAAFREWDVYRYEQSRRHGR